MQSVIQNNARAIRSLWYVWLGTILGGLYLLDYSEPYDSVSHARSYVFAALGTLLGLWLVSFPYVQRILLSVSRSGRRVVWTLGLSLTVSLGILETLRLIDLLMLHDMRLGEATFA